MSTNGCGHWGTVSIIWDALTGQRPPFHGCCNEHDLAYEQAETDDDRAWADKHLLRCMKRRGWKYTGYAFYAAVRLFGWIATK